VTVHHYVVTQGARYPLTLDSCSEVLREPDWEVSLARPRILSKYFDEITQVAIVEADSLLLAEVGVLLNGLKVLWLWPPVMPRMLRPESLRIGMRELFILLMYLVALLSERPVGLLWRWVERFSPNSLSEVSFGPRQVWTDSDLPSLHTSRNPNVLSDVVQLSSHHFGCSGFLSMNFTSIEQGGI
jgi:hypothetical protein